MAQGFKVAQGYLEVDVDYANLDAGIAGIEGRLKAIRDLAIKANLPTEAVNAAIADISAKLSTLKLKTLAIGGIDQTELNTSLMEIQSKLDAFTASHGLDIRTTGISDAVAKLMALRVAADTATGTGGGGGGGGGGAGVLGLSAALLGFGGVRGVLGVLNAQIPLFGGLLAGIPFVRTVGGAHLLIDSILEIAAVVIPAGIALAAFGVAASSTVNDIIKQEQAFQTITTALGTSFPGLTRGLQNFTDSVKPQVYVLFGEALDTINQHTGLFTQLATGAGQVLDNLGARAELALGGNGLSGLISHGVSDLQLLGNIIGNVFGIIGNVLRTLPDYAQLLFGALQNVTGALESITGSSFVQGLLGIGLALHGAVLWGGLAVTAIMALQGPLLGVATWVGGGINALVKFGLMFSAIAAQEGILAAATVTFQGAMAALAAVNPFVWVAIGVGALIGLVAWLSNTKTAAQQSLQAIDDLASKAITFNMVTQDLTQGLQQTNAQLSQTPKYITEYTGGMHDAARAVQVLNPAWQGLTSNSQALNEQILLQTSRLDQLNKITGSATATQQDLQQIGVKGLDVYKLSASAYAQVVTELKSLVNATTQLAGYQGGQALAAQNALTNAYMQETLPAIQKITQAENNLMNVVLGGQSAFNSYEQSIIGTTAKFVSPSGLADAAKLAGGNLTAINQQSLAFSNTLYTQSIPALQKMITNLQEQSISQGNLTKVVATGSEQILQYTGNNKEARTVMVDLINNALGPGTVTLKSLNQWVGTNSTSLGKMNGIVADSTTKVSGLGGVLSTTLKNMQAVALFQAQGGQQAWNIFTTDVEKGTTNSKSFTTATQEVMGQLLIQSNNSLPAAQRAFENYATQGLGLTKQQADNLWKTDLPGLQNEINSLHGKTVNVGLTASASGALHAAAQISGTSVSNIEAQLQFGAAGMMVKGGVPGKDSVLAALMPGEVVVPTNLVAAGLVDHLRGMIPGFALGGQVNLAAPSNWAANDESAWGTDVAQAFMKAQIAAFQKAVAQAQQVANIGSGVARWAGIVNQALQMLHLPTSLAHKVLLQMQTESGGNPNAINLTDSNAAAGDPSRGLLQTIMSTFQSYHVPGTSNNIYDPLANVAAAINYAEHVYGPTLQNSSGAGMGSGHGYHAGGFLPAGSWGYVGENGPEVASAGPGGTHISPLPGGDLGSKLDTMIKLTRDLINTTAAVPNGISRNVGNAGGSRAAVQVRYSRGGA